MSVSADREMTAPSEAVRSLVSRGPTPILVGVTGHRDLRPEDLAPLEGCVDAFFGEVRLRYRHSDIVVLTGLASGADQLVARCAARAGIPYVAVLPMELAEYERDFNGAERPEFYALLEGATRISVIPYGAETDVARIRSDPKIRAGRYDALGIHLVRNSAILLALWNGKDVAKTGGTSDVVALAQRGLSAKSTSLVARLDESIGPYVHHITTPRAGDPETIGEPFSTTALVNAEHERLEALDEQDQWNAQCAALLQSTGERDIFPPGVDVVDRTFALADTLAIADQANTQRAVLVLYVMPFVCALLFDAYDIEPLWPLITLDTLLTLATALFFLEFRRRNHQDCFQDYRALAEGLRVQAAWFHVGVIEDVTEHYLARQRGELEWIRSALRVAFYLQTLEQPPAMSLETMRERIETVRRDWIEDQASYFARASKKNAAKAARIHRWIMSFLVVAILSDLLLVALAIVHHHLGVGDESPVAIKVTFAVVTLSAVIAALVKDMGEKLAYRNQEDRYDMMRATYRCALACLDDILAEPFDDRNAARARALLVELGEEALLENGDWVMVRRERPLEFIRA